MKPKGCLTGADNNRLNVMGTSSVGIASTCRGIHTDIYVVKGSKRNLLGLPEIRQLNLLAVTNNWSLEIFDPLKEFQNNVRGIG